jgi:hypothetical protein
MELQGETLIDAPRERVWAALNDPAVLARCIDGVESLDKIGDTRFEGKLNAKVGPVRASFTGGVDLLNLDPPSGYTIFGEGKGGVAGFAKGSADVRLADETMPDGRLGTRLSYVARSTVGGKLAQLGARLIEGTARGYAESFFAKLKAEVETPAADAAPPPAAAPADEIAMATPARTSDGKPLSPLVWAGGVALLLLAVWLLLAG